MEPQQQQEVVAEVFSKQLAKKLRVPERNEGPVAQAAGNIGNLHGPKGGGAPDSGRHAQAPQPPRRGPTDTWFRWNALPNEYIVPIGVGAAEPLLGGSVLKWKARGVLRFPSSVQRIVFRTDNISAENQGILVEGWACWRIADPGLAVQKLDFADPYDPMAATSKILGIECAGIMKGLISVKSVNDLLKRREDLLDKLKEKLKSTEQRWGLSFDEIGISDVQVLSQDVFENLQRPFRNEAREVASTSDLDTEERIAQRTSAQRERVAAIESESARKLAELRSKSDTQTKQVEVAEETKRILAEQEVKNLRLEEEKRVRSLEDKLRRELEEETRLAKQRDQLAAIAAGEERALAEAKAREMREVETMRLQAERQQASVEADRLIRAAEREQTELRIQAERAAARADAERLAEIQGYEAARARAKLALDAELHQALLARKRGDAAADLDALERRRGIESQLSDAEIRARMIEALPRIAESVKIGDVRWYGGAAGSGDGPHGLLARAIEQVLAVCDAHGLDVKALLARKAEAAEASRS